MWRPELILAGREFAHIHPDASLNAVLPPPRADEAIEAGWAERHPLAEHLGVPGLVLRYTPRSLAEVGVVVGLIVDSYSFVSGGAVPARMPEA